jgi:uncharacterized membrane protein YkvA (DUF1232 family)
MTSPDDERPDDRNDVPVAEVLDEMVPAQPVSEKRASRFYDRIRGNIHEFLERRGSATGKAGDFLLLAPDVFILLWRLTTDRRVSAKNKAMLGSAIAYYVFPLDVMPEAILGPLGFLDDLVLGVYVLSRMLGDTDEAILREHWSGREDLLEMIRRVLAAADQLVAKDFVKQIKRMFK